MRKCIGIVALLSGACVTPALADVPAGWTAAQGTYEACAKTGGEMEWYFESVKLQVDGDIVTFVVQTFDFGPITTVYQPDGLVRRGNDFHYLEDGSILGPIPSHEASFWEEETLIREEITYLPGNTFATESNQVSIREDGALDYLLNVNDELWLSATCS